MRILALCYPLYRKQLHINSLKTYTILATDEIIFKLREKGIIVDVVSLYQPTSLPLRNSSKILSINDVDIGSYDSYLHTFRDPTQPEVIKLLDQLKLPIKPTVNDAYKLIDHSKWKYIPVLTKYGLSWPISNPTCQWGESTFNTKTSVDKIYICSAAYNNNHSEYPERSQTERIITRFIDNDASGVRSIFRIGYAFGKCTPGWIYCTQSNQVILKTGNALHCIPFKLQDQYIDPVVKVMNELNVDYAHIEGCFIRDKMYIFDINPYPTSFGNTLTFITENIVDIIIKELEGRINGRNSTS